MKLFEYNIEDANRFLLVEYKTEQSALKTLLALWRRMQSPEEKKAAELLYAKTLLKIATLFGKEVAKQMDTYVSSGQADEEDSKLKPAKRDSSGNIIIPSEELPWPPKIKLSQKTENSKPEHYKTWPYNNIKDFLNSKDNVLSNYFDPKTNWNFWMWRVAGPSAISPVIGFALYKNPTTKKFASRGYLFIDKRDTFEMDVFDIMSEFSKIVARSTFGIVPVNPLKYPDIMRSVIPTEQHTYKTKSN